MRVLARAGRTKIEWTQGIIHIILNGLGNKTTTYSGIHMVADDDKY